MHTTNTLQPHTDTHADATGTDPQYAVLVVVDPSTGTLLMTKRATGLRHHAGKMCFPGGRIEHGETTCDAALREAHEELALQSAHIHIDTLDVPAMSTATTYTTQKTFRIHYALLDAACDADTFINTLQPNPSEVARVMWVNPKHCDATLMLGDASSDLYRIHDAQHDEIVTGATADVCLALWARCGITWG